MTWSMIFEHLYIVLAACLLSILIGVPLGLLLPRMNGRSSSEWWT